MGKLHPGFRFQTKHISWCFCQSKTSFLSAESTFDDFNLSIEKILAFGFQWPDSVTRLLPPNSHKRALRCFQSFGECAWMASIMLFRIVVWDVHPIICLHPTTEKEKVLLPPRHNHEEIATSTQLSLQVQPWRASVAPMTPSVNRLWFCDAQFFFSFFFWFSAESYAGGWRET